MNTTWIKCHSVAGNYTITFGNLFGTNRKIVGKGTKAQALEIAKQNARSNGLTHFWFKVASGESVLTSSNLHSETPTYKN